MSLWNIVLERVASEPSGEGAVLFIDIVDINDNDFDGGGGGGGQYVDLLLFLFKIWSLTVDLWGFKFGF